MPRLFVALDLPRVVTKRLTRNQPLPLPGIRLVPPEHMHVTLHFIGETEVKPVTAALGAIEHPAFNITIANIGQFKVAGGGAVLWAGVNRNPELASLHAMVGRQLAGIGLELESRSYKPHITLARCGSAARSVLPDFIASHDSLLIPNIPVIALTLYSSDLSQGAPTYKQEGHYLLKA
jgi:2'-5' RNA ligase